jgi:hypothetical protein
VFHRLAFPIGKPDNPSDGTDIQACLMSVSKPIIRCRGWWVLFMWYDDSRSSVKTLRRTSLCIEAYFDGICDAA